MKTMSALILGIAIAFSGYFIGNSIVQFKKFDQSVEVKGLAERTVESNEADWNLGFSLSGNDLADLNTKALNAQKTMFDFLLGLGFVAEEVQKEPLNISDQWANSYGSKKGDRYLIRGSYRVNTKKVKEMDKAAAQADVLLKKGLIVTTNTIRFYYTDLNSIKPDMLKQATANAREAAQSFAANAGTALGSIKSATQGVFTITGLNDTYDNGGFMKKVRVVTRVDFFLH